MKTPEIKALWVEALRSGEYKQAKGALREDHGYCCLGVLCDVLNPLAWVKTPEEYIWALDSNNVEGGDIAFLPLFEREEIGISEGMQQKLVEMNDGGDSFQAIADYIEENL